MILSFSNQAIIFLISVIVGIILGLAYDVLRILRIIIKHSPLLIQIEDIIFWILGAVMAFMVMLKFNNGDIRPFIFLGIGLGIVIYFTLPSKLVMGFSNKLISLIKYIIRLVLSPVAKLLYILYKPVIKTKNLMYRKTKKLLHLRRMYVKLFMKDFLRNIKYLFRK